jgi:CIC family chloride channel protein
MMIAVGASAGVAAVFVSPLTGIAFAIENIAYQFIKQYVTYLILASVISFSIAINYLEPIQFFHSSEKLMNNDYIIANLIFIPFITSFIYFYLFLKKKVLHFIDIGIFKTFHAYRNHIFALLGGSVIGTILLIEPQAAFSGKEMVILLMNEEEHISIIVIFTLIFLRIVGTTVSIYANAVGGVFLPLMSIGALTGYAFGELMTQYIFDVEPFYFAAIGASIFMGVIMKLPLTAVILSLETTLDYNVVLATGISVVLVEYFSNLHFNIKKRYVNKADKIEKST